MLFSGGKVKITCNVFIVNMFFRFITSLTHNRYQGRHATLLPTRRSSSEEDLLISFYGILGFLATYKNDIFIYMTAILNSIVSNNYYGILRGQISKYLPLEHPIIAI